MNRFNMARQVGNGLWRCMLGAAMAVALAAAPAQAATPVAKILAVNASSNSYPGGTLSYTVSVTNPTASTWTILATVSGTKMTTNFPTMTVAVSSGTSVIVSAPTSVVTIPTSFHGKATLKVTAKKGTTTIGSLSQTFMVGDVVANISATPNNGTLPLTVQFTDASTTSSSITNWLWNFGDGTTSTLRNPSHQYIPYGTGTYTVSLFAQGPNGMNAKTNVNLITVRPPLPVNPSPTGVCVQITQPTNSMYFTPGERPWILMVLNDNSGLPLTVSQMSTLSLYMYGPQEESLTKAARNLLGGGTSVNLLTSSNVLVNGNVLAYQVNPFASELPGTYTMVLRATLSADNLQQWIPMMDCQVGTATVESQIVAREKCGACHYGPISGKYYMHHIDPSGTSLGDWARDSWPVRTCKACHNQDGGATVTDPRSGTKIPDPIVKRAHGIHMGVDLANLSSTGNWLMITNASGSFVVGNVVTGATSLATAQISMVDTNTLKTFLVVSTITGTLSKNENITSAGATAKYLSTRSGLFRDYSVDSHVVEFPQDVRNCTACHIDDRWKTAPSRQACGTCHDNLWFGDKSATPQGMTNHPSGTAISDSDFATPAAENYYCLVCHTTGGLGTSVMDAHYPGLTDDPGTTGMNTNTITIGMTRPANSKYYVAGETPVVSLVIKDDNGNALTNHTMVNTNWFSTVSLFVYGPRENSQPVLTRVASQVLDVASRPSVTCGTAQNWNTIPGQIFKIAINGSAPTNIVINAGVTNAAQFVAQINPLITNLCVSGIAGSGAVASVSSGKVKITSLTRGANSTIAIYNGPVTTAMGWKSAGVTMDPFVTAASLSTPANNLIYTQASPLDAPVDPAITVTTTNITYQLSNVSGLTPGTYFVFALDVPKSNTVANYANPCGIGFISFQVGTTNVDKKIATCTDCHGNTVFHLDWAHPHPAPFDADACKACHDYSHPNVGDMFSNQGGTSQNGWAGFGAVPISRRVHGVHYAHYLEHPEEIYSGATSNTFSWIIFPQDVRNCTKCHSQTDTWKQNPSRVACLACHDSDAAKAHGKIMTYMPTPSDPYGPDAEESCEVCHGDDTAFSPDKVHAISGPYVPPYPRN